MINLEKRIVVAILVILLVISFTVMGSYAVIINVTNKNGTHEIINEVRLRDFLTNDDGTFNNTYYNVKRELDITDEEANILMESEALNDRLKTVLNSIVTYRLDNDSSARMSNDEIYNLIVDGVNSDSNISDELREKVITKSNLYKEDISDYVYDTPDIVIGD